MDNDHDIYVRYASSLVARLPNQLYERSFQSPLRTIVPISSTRLDPTIPTRPRPPLLSADPYTIDVIVACMTAATQV